MLHGSGITLRDFAGIGAQYVEADDATVVRLVAYELRIAAVVLPVGDRPLQRLEVGMVYL